MFARIRQNLPKLPYPHFMGFAALDCWARMLFTRGVIVRVPFIFWPRLAAGLVTSSIGTVITLPERILLALPLARARARGQRDADKPPIVFVLGYYRSGTTHLHYLLSCDSTLTTPRWYQALAPQGFALSWTFLRYFLVPFLSSTRPQDDVAYGPEYPAEDDFASCNTNAACTMPGRMTLPREWDTYKRYQTLDGLSSSELRRFRSALLSFVIKLQWLNPSRGILLKSPAHTARVQELIALFGDRCRFIHLSRPAMPVLKSNVAMHVRYAPFLLQPSPGDDEIRRRVIEEYNLTERRLLADAAALPPSRLAFMRYQDLISDPLSEVDRVYSQLGMTLSPQSRFQMASYLETVKEYRAADRRPDTQAQGRKASLSSPEQSLPIELEWMHAAFGHSRPISSPSAQSLDNPASRAQSVASTLSTHHADASPGTPITDMLIASLWCAAAWLLAAYLGQSRFDWLVWPTGVAIGLTGLRAAKRGSLKLGIFAAALTLLTILLAAFPATWIADYRDRNPVPWDHVWLSTRRGVLATNNAFWIALGVFSAYRFATRKHLRPPGL